jgi:hypothetical protein
VSYDSSTSQPSHSWIRSPGKPVSSFEIEPPGVLTSTGTEIAYLLSSTTKTTGRRRLVAVLSASQNSPWLVVPSPVEQKTTSSPRIGRSASGIRSFCEYRSHASAHPTACRNWVPVGLEALTMLSSRCPQCDGICRPPELGSSAAATALSSCSVAVMPSPRQSARSR